MMKKHNGLTFRTYLTNIANIIKKNVNKSHLAQSRSIDALASTIERLDFPDSHEHLISTRDLESDSFEKVSYYIDLALKSFKNTGGPILDNAQQANFILALSETYENLGNYEAALSNYKIALELCTTLKNHAMQGQVHYRMARVYSAMGEWHKARRLLKKAIPALRSAGNHNEAALAQIELAHISFRKGEYLKAREIFQTALETTEQVGDIRNRAIISNHLGLIQRMAGEHDLAYTYFQQALIEFQSIQDFRGTAESLNNLGQLHLQRQEPRKAYIYFDKSLQLCQEIGYFSLMAFVCLNKTEYYCEIKDIPMAVNTCGRALEYLVRLQNPVGIAKTNLLFGRIFWKSGDSKTAEAFYKQSMSLYEKFRIPLGLANCYREFAQMLEKTGSVDESAHFFSKAQEIYHNLNMQIMAVKGQEKLKSIYTDNTKPSKQLGKELWGIPKP